MSMVERPLERDTQTRTEEHGQLGIAMKVAAIYAEIEALNNRMA